jgi:hypothetical protein
MRKVADGMAAGSGPSAIAVAVTEMVRDGRFAEVEDLRGTIARGGVG